MTKGRTKGKDSQKYRIVGSEVRTGMGVMDGISFVVDYM